MRCNHDRDRYAIVQSVLIVCTAVLMLACIRKERMDAELAAAESVASQPIPWPKWPTTEPTTQPATRRINNQLSALRNDRAR